MKLLILALLLISPICSAVEVVWSAPTARVNGQPLPPEEICCYEILVRDKASNKLLLTLKVNSTGVQKYRHLFSLPTNIVEANSKYQIAAIDTNGLYSRFVDIEKAKPLLAPTEGEIF